MPLPLPLGSEEKANKIIGLIYRHFYAKCSSSTLFTLLICPLLEYGSMIWDPISPTLISFIDLSQHHALKLVSKSWFTDYSSLLSQFCPSMLEHRRKIAKVTIIFKLKLNLMHSPNSPLISSPPPTIFQQTLWSPKLTPFLLHSTQQPSNYGTLFLPPSNLWLHHPFSNPGWRQSYF